MYSASTLILESKHQGCKKRHFFSSFPRADGGKKKKKLRQTAGLWRRWRKRRTGVKKRRKKNFPGLMNGRLGQRTYGVGGCYCCLLHCYADISRDIYVLICTDYIYIKIVCVCHERRWVGASAGQMSACPQL